MQQKGLCAQFMAREELVTRCKGRSTGSGCGMTWHTLTLWSFGQHPVMDETWDLEAKHPGLNLNPPCPGQADVGPTCTSVSPCIKCGGTFSFMALWQGLRTMWKCPAQ